MNRTTFLIALLLVPLGCSFAQAANRRTPVSKPETVNEVEGSFSFGGKTTKVILTISICMSPNEQNAKRLAPKEVKPVVYKGIRYTAPHWIVASGKRMAGGYVEAFDAKTNKKLWRTKVYETKYDPQLEKDVQDVFITSLAIEKNMLVVVNDRDERYEVDLKSHRVTRK